MEGELAKTLDSVSFSREEAKELVIGKVLGKSALITEIPHDAPGFNPDSGSDDDALDYAVLDPNYEEHGFDAEGLVMTQEQRQEAAATAFMEESQGAPEEDHPMEEDPVPPYVPAEPETGGAFATSTLQVSLEDPVSSSPTQALTPSSAVESIPSSEAVSAASSSTPEITRARRSTVAVRRSRNYRGPYVQPASSSSSSRSRAPTRRSPSPRRYSPPRRSSARPYSSADRPSYRRSPSPGYGQVRRRSPSPPTATMGSYRGRGLPSTPGVRIIHSQEQQRIVQDVDTGISAIVPVMQVSSSQMGLDLSALIQPAMPDSSRGRIGPQGYAPPRSVEGSRERSGTRYRPRSRSPRREYYSRPRSPSPRRSDHGSSQYSSRSGPQRSPPRRPDPPRRRSPRPTSSRWQSNEPTRQDPMAIWGESTDNVGPNWESTGPAPAAESFATGNNSSPGAGPSGTYRKSR